MEEQTHSLSESQLQAIVQSAVKEALQQRSNVLTAKNLFDDVRVDSREIELINDKFEITDVLEGSDRHNILTNISFPSGWGKSYTKVHNTDIHNNMRKLVLNVFGKTLSSEFTRDEYEMARVLYAEVREWFMHSYETRLTEMQKQKKLTTPASN